PDWPQIRQRWTAVYSIAHRPSEGGPRNHPPAYNGRGSRGSRRPPGRRAAGKERLTSPAAGRYSSLLPAAAGHARRERMPMSPLLVTGGCGFIGSNFVRHLLERDPDVHLVNLDALTYAGNLANLADLAGHPRYRFVKGDIADRETLRRVFRLGVRWVVHFAAESHVDRSILDSTPFVRTNVLGTQALLDAAREHKVERFVHVSTDEVYGSLGPTGCFTEETPLAPSSPYAASKAAA